MTRQSASLAAVFASMSVALLTPPCCLAQRAGTPGPVAAPTMHTGGPGTAPGSVQANRGTSSSARINTSRSRTRTRSSAIATDTARQSEDAFAGLGLGGGFPLSLEDLLGVMPNNGFDWQYVNSINQDLAVKAFIDPVTQIEVAQAERLLRSTGGGAVTGAYILGGGGYYFPPEQGEGEQAPAEGPPPEGEELPAQGQQPQNQQPQIIVLQQAPAQSAQAAPQGEMEEQAQELPDRGPFTLVLRNGRQIQAVAFTHTKGKIIYITPEGGRLSFDAGDLDTDATTRVNEERGTPVQLPL